MPTNQSLYLLLTFFGYTIKDHMSYNSGCKFNHFIFNGKE